MNLIPSEKNNSPYRLSVAIKEIKTEVSFKYLLKCNGCPWIVSFYEATGSIYIDSRKSRCPVCNRNEITVSKILF